MLWSWWLALSLGGLDCHYREAEAAAAQDAVAPRDEGFTSWMGHPSGGRVIVAPAGAWAEYAFDDLGDRDYWIHLRALAWAGDAVTEVSWNGRPLGRATYPRPTTALRWSAPLGPVRGPGRLRLTAAGDNRQVPYWDVVLATSEPDLRPGDEDDDFLSFSSIWPVLRIGETRLPPRTVAAPGEAVAPRGLPTITSLELGPHRLGPVALRVGLDGAGSWRLTARFDDSPEVGADLALAGPTEVTLSPEMLQPRRGFLTIALRPLGDEGGARRGSLCRWAIQASPPVRMRLESHAVAVGTPVVRWRAEFDVSDAIAGRLSATIELTGPAGSRGVTLGGRPGGMTAELPAADLPRGRYAVNARVTWDGVELEPPSSLPLHVYDPVAQPAWEPVRRTHVDGDRLFLNGRPFLGRLLYHAAPTAEVRERGFNLVQCFGGDPDPLDSIQAHLDACAEIGLYGAVALFNNRFFLHEDRFDLEHVRLAVERFRDHPALWGWDLIDEPEVALSPAAVAEGAELVRRLDPNHFVWVNLCMPDRGLDYLAAQDLWSFDRYPLGTAEGLHGYQPWLTLSDEHLRGRRPIGTVLQTYASPNQRMPTPEELRASLWLHAIHDYRWFGFYSYYDPEPAGCLARDAVLHDYCRALGAEMLAMEPVLLAPTPFEPVPVNHDAVVAAAKTVDGRRWLVAVNLDGEPRSFTVSAAGRSAVVQFEAPATIAIDDGRLSDELAAQTARVYELVD